MDRWTDASRRTAAGRRTGVGRALGSVLIAVGLGACGFIGPGTETPVDLAPDGGPALELTYLGTGGWIMEWEGEQLLTGPLFTNPRFLRTGLAPISSDTVLVDRHMGPYDVSAATAILVGHAHYDHLMDVPLVATRHATEARIFGSETVANTLGTWAGVADRLDLIEEEAVSDQHTVGSWTSYGQRVRVMPLRSHHAPHFEELTLYEGSVDRARSTPPRHAREWLAGETFAFLVDFLDVSGETALRVYYQDAVAWPPFGFAPDALIAERPVDVAIFVPATFDQVDWHPEAFVENLKPRWVLLGHWENFFRPIDQSTRSIMLTDIHRFEERLDRVFDGGWWRPDIGIQFRFPSTR